MPHTVTIRPLKQQRAWRGRCAQCTWEVVTITQEKAERQARFHERKHPTEKEKNQ